MKNRIRYLIDLSTIREELDPMLVNDEKFKEGDIITIFDRETGIETECEVINIKQHKYWLNGTIKLKPLKEGK